MAEIGLISKRSVVKINNNWAGYAIIRVTGAESTEIPPKKYAHTGMVNSIAPKFMIIVSSNDSKNFKNGFSVSVFVLSSEKTSMPSVAVNDRISEMSNTE